ncbi:MAG: hypothetical protein ABW090_09285 [Sedimenticola sp.]
MARRLDLEYVYCDVAEEAAAGQGGVTMLVSEEQFAALPADLKDVLKYAVTLLDKNEMHHVFEKLNQLILNWLQHWIRWLKRSIYRKSNDCCNQARIMKPEKMPGWFLRMTKSHAMSVDRGSAGIFKNALQQKADTECMTLSVKRKPISWWWMMSRPTSNC